MVGIDAVHTDVVYCIGLILYGQLDSKRCFIVLLLATPFGVGHPK